ncbi:MAG TPA: hypothetical protein PLW09_02295, partial [Candidatus Kapabacteria bacterium]|nr:hypothetical protein [Candidatus Kapabacteria bacterium]
MHPKKLLPHLGGDKEWAIKQKSHPTKTKHQSTKTHKYPKKLLPHLGGDKEGAIKQKSHPTKTKHQSTKT